MKIVEVGPRDGLQNEAQLIPTRAKVAFIDALSESGLESIEATSFVSPKWIPQLADAEEVLAAIHRRPGVRYSVLVPNEHGLERALPLKPDEVAVFTAASETFSRKNVNTSIDGSFSRIAPTITSARTAGLRVRAYISTAIWCPYEGYITPQKVLAVTERLLELGVHEVSLGDTIGKASADEVEALLTTLYTAGVKPAILAMHFHDTFGRAFENILRSISLDISIFDASANGIGGCPFAPGAKGNVSTERVIEAIHHAGHQVSVDVTKVRAAFDHVRPFISQKSSLPLGDQASVS